VDEARALIRFDLEYTSLLATVQVSHTRLPTTGQAAGECLYRRHKDEHAPKYSHSTG